jgi:L-alanine-DL-glutamate epimerase-like enolase superfamily enzyme
VPSAWDRLADLPLVVDRYALEDRRVELSPEFTRATTTIHLHGRGEVGQGEDVTYMAEDHDRLQAAGPTLPLPGEWTLASFAERIGDLDLFPGHPPVQPAFRLYRRWAFESAALDLALRQAGTSLHEHLGVQPRPVTFVNSLRLPEPPSLEPVRARLEHYPELRFKLDARSSWSDELIAELVATGAVDSIDFKGFYSGTIVDQPPDAVLYRRIVDAFPDAWLEDPALTAETRPIIEPVRDRATWDAPIHGIADIETLPWPPRMVNVKPSRVGGLRELCDTYDYCAERGIRMYGGGQFELGPGRGQIQYLASLMHPDGPNDVAPVGYNEPSPGPGLPASPLAVAMDGAGFRWGDADPG